MRKAWEKLLGLIRGKSGQPVVVLFAGSDPASRLMAREMPERFPNHPRILAGWEPLDRSLFSAVDEVIELAPSRPLHSLFVLRRRLARRPVALMMSVWPPRQPAGLRWIPLVAAPRKWLAFHPGGDRHYVSWRRPIASWRFLRGEPVEEIFRPTAFAFVKEIAAWLPASLLLAGWLLARARASKIPAAPEEPSAEGFTVMCLPGEDFPQRLDDEVRRSNVAEVVFTPHPTLPDSETIAALRACLRHPGVWLVCARAGSMHVLGEKSVAPAENETGAYCLGASSSIFLFRRDDYLRLGGLGRLEKCLPGHGLAALSLLGWLRGRKTVYAGHVSFQEPESPEPDNQPGLPLEGLIVAAVDHLPTAARLLHRYGRRRAFWGPFGKAALQLRPPRVGGRRTAALVPLVAPGVRVFSGRETGRRMRLAVVSPRLPYPLSGTGAIRILNLLRRTAQHCDIFLFCYSNNDLAEHIQVILDFCARLVLVKPPAWETPRLAALWPAGVMRYHLPQMRAYLAEFVSDFQIGIVQAEFAELGFVGSWPRQARAKRILVEHDIAFHLHQQLASQVGGGKNFSARMETARWKRYELNGMRGFDRVVTMSPVDRQRLIEHGVPEGKLEVVGNGIDLDLFHTRQPNPGNWRVLFRGSFRYLPDLLGFRFLLERVWPLILRERPEARLSAVTGPDSAACWKRHTGQDAPELPSSVEVHGFVEDVRPLYESSSVVAAPSPVSAGANIALLEALAMGRPIVSTAAACAGLGLEPGRHVLVADDPQGFAHALLRLLENPSLRQRLAENGRLLVEERFGWDQLAEKQLNLYEELLREA